MKWTVVAASLFCLAGAFAADQAKLKRVPAKATLAHQGRDLYREYCAVCHGIDGKGGGPAASALTSSPGDLTAIARLNGGTFPEIRMQRVLTGEGGPIAAHGSRDMPIWGQIFRHTSPDQEVGRMKVFNLVKHLESMQAK